jgi:peptidoglycan-N-acetylglucosamine deacetylase
MTIKLNKPSSYKKSLFVLSGVVSLLLVVACGEGLNTPETQKEGVASTETFVGSQLYGRDLPEKTVALTFDDGPGARGLELGTYLKTEGIRAAYFVVGKVAINSPNTLKTLQSQGHLIANHSYNHLQMTKLKDPVSEVRRTDDVIKSYVDNGKFLFRPPYGDWNSRVASILNNAGLKKYVGSIFWDVGGVRANGYSADWDCWPKGDSIQTCGNGYLKEIRAKGKGIVLMHDVHNKTVDMVKYMVPILKKEGYKFIRVDEVPNIKVSLSQAPKN